jgi:ABC-type Zn uptake system ZnuABC Zn-binding protein ZnuA
VRKAPLLVFLPLLLLASFACQPKPHERLVIAVSVAPLDDLVRRIAGPDADVTLVLPQGAPVEAASAPPDAAAHVAGAKVLVSVGLGLDPWMDALLPSAAPKAHLLKLGDRVPTITRADGTIDPYVWGDPQRARLMATVIAEDLARADVSHAIAFRERASVLDESLASLDGEIEARTASWPTHDVATLPPNLAYFAERYGLHAKSVGPLAAVTSAATNAKSYEEQIRLDAAALGPASR